MTTDDTIAAFASPVLPGGRIVLRLSGPASHRLTEELCGGCVVTGCTSAQHMLDFHGYRFPAWVYRFVAPHSYTGEDAVEFHLPGNPLLARELLAALLERGARSAEPGEFTARAFFHGRLDLTEAEGVAAVISAADAAGARSSRQLLSGELARRLRGPMDRLAGTLSLLEAEIDFSEEDVSFLSTESLQSAIGETRKELAELMVGAARLRPLSLEPTIAFVGRPNAGKSTLVNALVGKARSVVSDEAGTTRDVLSSTLRLPGGLVTLLDVAGLDTAATGGDIAGQMRQRAEQATQAADRIVRVVAADDRRPPVPLSVEADLVVVTKADLVACAADTTWVSAHNGSGLEVLRDKLDRLIFTAPATDALMVNQRHEQEIRSALEAVDRADGAIESRRPELIAAELRRALDDLGSVLGVVTPDDILGKIFATFCIGK